ncbi:MAG: repressor LexA [Deltaproteobacteria bacterium]|jgi:repressor LexA|nr:repressor LexA [Deltaproteobacteria bacterium]
MTLTTSPLTPKEKVVLEFLEMYARLNGFAPTYQEICKHFGFASFNSAQRYLKQLEAKDYISLGGANQKRAISLLRSASAYQEDVEDRGRRGIGREMSSETSDDARSDEASGARSAEAFQIPMLGRVAAGAPLEAFENDEFIDVPSSLVKNPDRTFALRVQGQSMIEDGIFDGDVILVQRQSQAENGEIVVAVVPGEHGPEEATVKRFFLQAVSDKDSETDPNTIRLGKTSTKSSTKSQKRIELRPANSTMTSFWYSPGEVQIRGVVVGLIRRFF